MMNYLTVTRYDTAFVVSGVSQFLSAPSTTHWDAVVRILMYLKKSLEKGHLYLNCGHTKVADFSDVDWVRSPVEFLGGNLML